MKRISILILALFFIGHSSAQVEIIGGNEVDSVIELLPPINVTGGSGGGTGSGGNLSLSDAILLFWLLNGSNAPPSADWNMGGFDFANVGNICFQNGGIQPCITSTASLNLDLQSDIINLNGDTINLGSGTGNVQLFFDGSLNDGTINWASLANIFTIADNIVSTANLTVVGNVSGSNLCYGNGRNQTGGLCNNITETDPIWSANFSNMQNSCPTGNYTFGFFGNGSMRCANDLAGAGASFSNTNIQYLNESETNVGNNTWTGYNNFTNIVAFDSNITSSDGSIDLADNVNITVGGNSRSCFRWIGIPAAFTSSLCYQGSGQLLFDVADMRMFTNTFVVGRGDVSEVNLGFNTHGGLSGADLTITAANGSGTFNKAGFLLPNSIDSPTWYGSGFSKLFPNNISWYSTGALLRMDVPNIITNGAFNISTNLTVGHLISCDSVDTDSLGKLQCGTDASGGGGGGTPLQGRTLFSVNECISHVLNSGLNCSIATQTNDIVITIAKATLTGSTAEIETRLFVNNLIADKNRNKQAATADKSGLSFYNLSVASGTLTTANITATAGNLNNTNILFMVYRNENATVNGGGDGSNITQYLSIRRLSDVSITDKGNPFDLNNGTGITRNNSITGITYYNTGKFQVGRTQVYDISFKSQIDVPTLMTSFHWELLINDTLVDGDEVSSFASGTTGEVTFRVLRSISANSNITINLAQGDTGGVCPCTIVAFNGTEINIVGLV